MVMFPTKGSSIVNVVSVFVFSSFMPSNIESKLFKSKFSRSKPRFGISTFNKFKICVTDCIKFSVSIL